MVSMTTSITRFKKTRSPFFFPSHSFPSYPLNISVTMGVLDVVPVGAISALQDIECDVFR